MTKVDYQVNLPISILREGDSFIAYTPALDLSTVGDTFEEVKKRFEEAVQIFFEETISKGTMEEALSALGWQKINNHYAPPTIVSHQTESFSIPNFAS